MTEATERLIGNIKELRTLLKRKTPLDVDETNRAFILSCVIGERLGIHHEAAEALVGHGRSLKWVESEEAAALITRIELIQRTKDLMQSMAWGTAPRRTEFAVQEQSLWDSIVTEAGLRDSSRKAGDMQLLEEARQKNIGQLKEVAGFKK